MLPWNPIIQYEKSFSRNYIPGEWQLKLRLYTRNLATPNYEQDFAVVIEIIDTNLKVNVYNEILTEQGSLYQKVKFKIAA